MTNEITTTEAKAPARWKTLLDQGMPAIAASLPKHVTKDKFRQVAATALGSTPMLRQCMESNPTAVLTALAHCAADGLVPDNRKAALVPFKTRDGLNLTYIPMIAGVLQRMRNSGEVVSVTARVVHKNDPFVIDYGDNDKIEHAPCLDGEPGPRIGAYAIIKLKGGETYREFMTAKQITAVKNASRAKGGPWSGPFEDEMWRKTVLKRAAKYCPFSDDLSSLFDRDNDFYDPSKTIDAEPRPDIRERFAAAQTLEHERKDNPDNDTGMDDDRDLDASDSQYERVSDEDQSQDSPDTVSPKHVEGQGEADSPQTDASPAPSTDDLPAKPLVGKPFVKKSDEIRAAKTSKAAEALFKTWAESDAGMGCTDAEFAFVEDAKNWRMRQGQ